jgi:tRNA threonylcarbamoyl adenosine modification protein YeaZ
MIIISSSQKDVYVIYKGENIITEKINGRSSGSKIVSKIKKIIDENGITLSEVNEFGIDVGPGSFTGIRIGIAVIQGLLFGRQNYSLKKFYSSDVMSYEFNTKKIAVINRARDDAAYITLYDDGKRITEPKMVFVEELKRMIKDRVLIGEQANHFKNKYELKNEIIVPSIESENYIYAYNQGQNIKAEDLEPLYIQKPIAVENYEKQNNKTIDDI